MKNLHYIPKKTLSVVLATGVSFMNVIADNLPQSRQFNDFEYKVEQDLNENKEEFKNSMYVQEESRYVNNQDQVQRSVNEGPSELVR